MKRWGFAKKETKKLKDLHDIFSRDKLIHLHSVKGLQSIDKMLKPECFKLQGTGHPLKYLSLITISLSGLHIQAECWNFSIQKMTKKYNNKSPKKKIRMKSCQNGIVLHAQASGFTTLSYKLTKIKHNFDFQYFFNLFVK